LKNRLARRLIFFHQCDDMAKPKLYSVNLEVFKRLDAKDKRRFLKLGPQADTVFTELLRVTTPRLIESITEQVKDDIESVQPIERVVGFYLNEFSKVKVNGVSLMRTSLSLADMGGDIEKLFAKKYAVVVDDTTDADDDTDDDTDDK
jgi:hypothetical protein